MKGIDMGNEKKMDASEAPHNMHDHEHMKMDMEGTDHNMGGHDHSQMKMNEGNLDMSGEPDISHGSHNHDMRGELETNHERGAQMDHSQHDVNGIDGHDMSAGTPANTRIEQPPQTPGKEHTMSHMDHAGMDHSVMHHGAMHNMHMPSPDQPMFPTVTIAVCHCGAGCLLGDIVGEWLVFGTNATLGGKSIGPEFLIGIVPSSPLVSPHQTIVHPPQILMLRE
jgi:hypothetical protein